MELTRKQLTRKRYNAAFKAKVALVAINTGTAEKSL